MQDNRWNCCSGAFVGGDTIPALFCGRTGRGCCDVSSMLITFDQAGSASCVALYVCSLIRSTMVPATPTPLQEYEATRGQRQGHQTCRPAEQQCQRHRGQQRRWCRWAGGRQRPRQGVDGGGVFGAAGKTLRLHRGVQKHKPFQRSMHYTGRHFEVTGCCFGMLVMPSHASVSTQTLLFGRMPRDT